ncbi:MAG: hypothetical protein ABI759_19305 [Candidatus Solibacter sp.]
MARDDFSTSVKQQLANRVNHRCSHPECRATTSGPQLEPEGSINVGVAAHITAASPGGPRFDAAISPENRASASNGVWLCQNCAKLVDNDARRFPAELLREWKARAEAVAFEQIGRTSSPCEKPAHSEERAAPFSIKDLSEVGGLNLDGYKIFQALDLNSYSNGIDGSALILVDERLEGLRGAIKRDPYSGIETLDVEPDPSAWFLPQQDVNEALMLIVDQRLRILYSERLGRESARLDRVFLYQDRSKPTFVLTRDYSIGSGSYNGPISYFLEVSDSGIRYILPHGLMTSLKTAWAIVPTNSTAEILSKKCRPDFENSDSGTMEFKVIYERFTLEDGFWQTKLREQSGFWEFTASLDPKEFAM